MNKMNFYKFLEQQYKDYKIDLDRIFTTSCDGCPCKTLREEVFGVCEQTGCTDEMAYLVDKYKINDVEAYSCDGCTLAAVRIAKKLFGKKEFNKI